MARILHADQFGRESLLYDLIEPYRTAGYALVLGVLNRTTFRVGDFLQERSGQCRLHPQSARAVVVANRIPQAEIGATARELKSQLLNMIVPKR